MWEMLILSIVLIAVAALAFFTRKKPQKRSARTTVNSRYSAVTINHPLFACNAVSKLDHRRMLAREAPSLPVEGCDVWPCRCRYQHFKDRRADERRSLFGSRAGVAPGRGGERRRHERRQTAPV